MRRRIEDAQRRLDALAAQSDAQRARLAALVRDVVAPRGVAAVGLGVWRALGRARPWIVAGAAAFVILRPSRVVGWALRWWPAVAFARRLYRTLPQRGGSPPP